MPRELTQKQRLFLDVLFDKAQGSIVQAKKLAGYSDGTSSSEVVRSLKDEINEATREYLARVAPKAAFSMANVLDDPTDQWSGRIRQIYKRIERTEQSLSENLDRVTGKLNEIQKLQKSQN